MANAGMGDPSEIRKKLSHNYEMIATTYHEAGHTIGGLLHHMMIYSVGVDVSKDKRSSKDLGYTYFEAPLDFAEETDRDLILILIQNEICINYAGLAADKILYNELIGTYNIPMVLKFGSYYDRDNVAELIKKNNLVPAGKERHLYKKEFYAKTQRELEEHWGDIRLIAHALYAKKTLTFSDIKDILSKKSDNKFFWRRRLKNIELLFKHAKTNKQFVIDTLLK